MAFGYYLISGRGATNIRIREYQYPEYRGPTVYVNLYNCRVLDFMIKSRMLSAVSNCCPLTFMTFFSKSILGFDFSINAIYNVFPLCPKHHLVASERNVARIPYIETNPNPRSWCQPQDITLHNFLIWSKKLYIRACKWCIICFWIHFERCLKEAKALIENLGLPKLFWARVLAFFL